MRLSPTRVAVLLGLCLAAEACAQETNAPPSEYQVKAAYLLNFTRFVAWPATAFADPDVPLTICILGEDPFGATLDRVVEGETVDGHRLAVQRLQRTPASKSCHVLYVAAGEREQAKLLRGLDHETLTVGEGEGFLRAGGVLAFVLEDRRVRFSINLAAANRSDVKLSSKLLNVARSVLK
ncbi:MAG: YfiR family protein [Candidatus Solibacter sp.]